MGIMMAFLIQMMGFKRLRYHALYCLRYDAENTWSAQIHTRTTYSSWMGLLRAELALNVFAYEL